jgi:glutamate synthase domain-containing protein 3
VLDPGGNLRDNCNMEMVIFDAIDDEDVARVRRLVINHLRHTSSSVAQEVLLDWNRYINHLVKVIPVKYKSIMDAAKSEMPMTPIY